VGRGDRGRRHRPQARPLRETMATSPRRFLGAGTVRSFRAQTPRYSCRPSFASSSSGLPRHTILPFHFRTSSAARQARETCCSTSRMERPVSQLEDDVPTWSMMTGARPSEGSSHEDELGVVITPDGEHLLLAAGELVPHVLPAPRGWGRGRRRPSGSRVPLAPVSAGAVGAPGRHGEVLADRQGRKMRHPWGRGRSRA